MNSTGHERRDKNSNQEKTQLREDLNIKTRT